MGTGKNVRQPDGQFSFSDSGNFVSPDVKDSYHTQKVREFQKANRGYKKGYKVIVEVVVEQTSFNGSTYEVEVSIPLNSNLLVTTAGSTSEAGPKQFTVLAPKETPPDETSIPLVYGVHSQGSGSFSHNVKHPGYGTIAYLSSSLLVLLDRAIKCVIQQQENEKRRDDTRGRLPGS